MISRRKLSKLRTAENEFFTKDCRRNKREEFRIILTPSNSKAKAYLVHCMDHRKFHGTDLLGNLLRIHR